jgi:cytochrome c2
VNSGQRWLKGLVLALGALALSGLLACQPTPSNSAAPAAALSGAAADGKQLFVTKGCVACHRAPGVPEASGTIGPNLKGVGDPKVTPKIAATIDNTPDNMKRWVMNPQAMKNGTSMPNLGLTDDEATRLVAFLETLK